MTRLTRFVLDHKRLVLAFWAVVAVAAFASLQPSGNAFSQQFDVARATGGTTLRVIGFFSSSTVVSTFEQPIGPEGERLHVTGSVQPFLAEVPEPAALAV